MKKLILFFALLLLGSKAYSQDEFKFKLYATNALIPVKIKGTYTTLDDNGTRYFNHPVIDEHRIIDTTGFVFGIVLGFGGSVPLYQTENWSVGSELNLALGQHLGGNAAEGLSALILEVPAYMYFKHFGTGINYSLLAGYKYTYAAFSYSLPMAAAEISFENGLGVRLFGSLLPYKYYISYSNGKEEPGLTIREYGISLQYNF